VLASKAVSYKPRMHSKLYKPAGKMLTPNRLECKPLKVRDRMYLAYASANYLKE
jgi:hypothetical protein